MKKMLCIASFSTILVSCGLKDQNKTIVLNSNQIPDSRLELINQNQLSTSSTFNMTLIARLNPPLIDTLLGQSTSIDIASTKAYVSFNMTSE